MGQIIRITRKSKVEAEAITAERLRQILKYDPETGNFTWLIRKGRNRVYVAGTPSVERYVVIMVDGVVYQAHRLAWLYMTGEWPKGYIDHINGTRNDNRFANLRDATGSQNQANRGANKNSKSGHKGVRFHQKSGKWVAEIQIGSFADKQSAIEARAKVESFIHGDFAFGAVLAGYDELSEVGGDDSALAQKRGRK